MFNKAEIPYGGYWSTPFAKWQAPLQHVHALRFAACVGMRELAKRGLQGDTFDFGVLGTTVLQHRSFFGAPWLPSYPPIPPSASGCSGLGRGVRPWATCQRLLFLRHRQRCETRA